MNKGHLWLPSAQPRIRRRPARRQAWRQRLLLHAAKIYIEKYKGDSYDPFRKGNFRTASAGADQRRAIGDGVCYYIEIESIRLVRPDVAVVDGTVRFVAQMGPVDTTSYTTIYVREDNQWKLDSIREMASPSPPTYIFP